MQTKERKHEPSGRKKLDEHVLSNAGLPDTEESRQRLRISRFHDGRPMSVTGPQGLCVREIVSPRFLLMKRKQKGNDHEYL